MFASPRRIASPGRPRIAPQPAVVNVLTARAGPRSAYYQQFGGQQRAPRLPPQAPAERFGRIVAKYPKLERANTLVHLGTLGTGNHFIEVDVVDQVFDLGAANTLGAVGEAWATPGS